MPQGRRDTRPDEQPAAGERGAISRPARDRVGDQAARLGHAAHRRASQEDPHYQGPDELGGVFSGWDEATQKYAVDSWQYDGEMVPSALAERHANTDALFEKGTRHMTEHAPPRDETLQHPNCVYQIMRRHYARYTPEMVEQVTGCPAATFLRVCDTYAAASGREETGAICYAVSWTHQTVGVQIIRAASMLQALLGNMGRPGGGIMALRSHCSIQGSTDIPTMCDMLPTYLPQPDTRLQHSTFREYLKTETAPTGWWNNFPKYITSLLKSCYGDAAQKDNDFCYDHLLKMVGDHSQLPMTLATTDGALRGLFVLGQNPLVGSVNADFVQRGMANLDWLVVRDFALTESADFWRQSGPFARGKMKSEEIGTEVFFLSAALPGEKDGTLTNTSRLVQWHDKVCDPPGDSRSEAWFTFHLGRPLPRAGRARRSRLASRLGLRVALQPSRHV